MWCAFCLLSRWSLRPSSALGSTHSFRGKLWIRIRWTKTLKIYFIDIMLSNQDFYFYLNKGEYPYFVRIFVLPFKVWTHYPLTYWVCLFSFTSVESEHSESAKTMCALGVWQEAVLPGGLRGWKLSETFRSNLRVALLGGWVCGWYSILYDRVHIKMEILIVL